MTDSIRILMAEDSPTDAELSLRELRRDGLRFDLHRVETEGAFVRALTEFRPDIILSDYSMPGFDGLAALRIARAASPETPFILVSGAIGEERAIEILKGGATDYVMKGTLGRLPSAVRRAVAEAAERAERLAVQRSLQASEARFRAMFDHTAVGIVLLEPNGWVLLANPAFQKMAGQSAEEMGTKPFHDLIHPDDREGTRRGLAQLVEGELPSFCVEIRFARADGRPAWGRLTTSAVADPSGRSS